MAMQCETFSDFQAYFNLLICDGSNGTLANIVPVFFLPNFCEQWNEPVLSVLVEIK